MIPFLLGFLLLELFSPEPVVTVHCFIDDLIPFNEWFILPYFLWYAWVPVFMLIFMLQDKSTYLYYCFVLFAGATICLIVYAVYPNGLDLRREITADNFAANLVRFIRMIDPPRNVCPSIHVASTVAVHAALNWSRKYNDNMPLLGLSWLVTALICISTMFVKQHSFIDVCLGIALTAVLAWIAAVICKIPGLFKGSTGENKE